MIGASLRRHGILGINRRNFDFVQCWNPRWAYREVDDKVATKRMAAAAGVPTPETIGVVSALHQLRRLPGLLESHASFVLKPARGAQGNGILVAAGREDGQWRRPSGRAVSLEEIRYRISEILSGLFSLGGQPDRTILEECLTVHPALRKISHGGVPDLRVILYRGIPAMAMLRLPTRASEGRANLHQGAVGVGIDLASGRSLRAVMRSREAAVHPDTREQLVGVSVPGFEEALVRAVRLGMASHLGYLGVDLVIDKRRGPVVLELNARPGLAIQSAHGRGLVPVLEAIDRRWRPLEEPAQRVALGREIAAELWS